MFNFLARFETYQFYYFWWLLNYIIVAESVAGLGITVVWHNTCLFIGVLMEDSWKHKRKDYF
jgi:hypothetical protein